MLRRDAHTKAVESSKTRYPARDTACHVMPNIDLITSCFGVQLYSSCLHYRDVLRITKTSKRMGFGSRTADSCPELITFALGRHVYADR